MDSGQIQQLGRYEILTRLSEGGFGEVYAACLRSMADFSTLVAIKLLHANLLSDGLTVKSFADEARIGGRLLHPNITRVLGFEEEGGRFFLVMELVDGVSFGQLVHHQRSHDDIAPATILEMIAQACDGLHHAHGLRDDSGKAFGLVHRDIKPSNLMLDRSGMVKVMDFGIAKAQAEGRDPTLTGTLKGTPAYMAPEMARGEKGVDLRADIFAMGAVLYELLTARRLYEGSQLALIHLAASADLTEQLAALEGAFPPEVINIVNRALAREPEDRFSSAAEMARDCRRAILQMGAVPEVRELAAELAPPPIRQGRSRIGDTTAGDDAHLTVLPWSTRVPGGAQGARNVGARNEDLIGTLPQGGLGGGYPGDIPATIPPTLFTQGPQGATQLGLPPTQLAPPHRGSSPSVPLVPLLGGIIIAMAIVLGVVIEGRVSNNRASKGEVISQSEPGETLSLTEEGAPGGVASLPAAPAPTPTPTPTPEPTPTPRPVVRRAKPPAQKPASRVAIAPKPAETKPAPVVMVSLMVNTAPEEQPIWIDGREVGKTPWKGMLPAGSHTVEVGEARGGRQLVALKDKGQVWLGIKGSGGWEFTRY